MFMLFQNQISASFIYTAWKFLNLTLKIRKHLNNIPKKKCQHNILIKLFRSSLQRCSGALYVCVWNVAHFSMCCIFFIFFIGINTLPLFIPFTAIVPKKVFFRHLEVAQYLLLCLFIKRYNNMNLQHKIQLP